MLSVTAIMVKLVIINSVGQVESVLLVEYSLASSCNCQYAKETLIRSRQVLVACSLEKSHRGLILTELVRVYSRMRARTS